MKKQFNNQLRRIFISALLFVFSTIFSFGQNPKTRIDGILKNPEYQNQWSTIQNMRKQNVGDNIIMDYLEAQSKTRGRQPSADQQLRSSKLPAVNAGAPCSGMGVEAGWGAWKARTGGITGGVITWDQTPAAAITPTGPRFNLTSGAGVDACTPGPAAGAPSIPVVCPGFGTASIQIGQPQTNGSLGGCTALAPCCTSNPTLDAALCLLPCVSTPSSAGCIEELSYPLLVTTADTNFVYSYAVVIEDPGHSATDQPYVSFSIYDQLGNAIPCGHFQYIAGGGLPGFYTASCNVNSVTYYKPWTLVGINLSPYVGQTLNVVITNADCGQSGHYAQAYFDFNCGTLSGSLSTGTCGSAATICGPVDPNIAYTYQWSQNGAAYTGPPSATAQCINPTFQTGDVFTVAVSQPSGCGFNLVFQPQSGSTMTVTTTATPATCGSSNGTATANAVGSSGYTYAWNTSPPQNTQTATGLGAGTYTATVTDAGGCTTAQVATITNSSAPTAAFTNIPVCIGNVTPFTDHSTAVAGDPIATYSWTFGDGNTSTTQSPTNTYTAAGTYSVTQTITSQAGCVGSTAQTVTVNPTPVSSFTFSTVCFNNPTVFTDGSTGATQWNWNFGDANTSAQQGPSHTYGSAGTYTVTQVTANSFGCKDTIQQTIVVNPLPIANFTSTPVCFGNATTFTDGSSISTGSISTWSWTFGDPASGLNNMTNLQSPSHIFTAPGNYSVTLTVTSNTIPGCQSTVMVPATVNPPPVAGFNTTNLCLNSGSILTDGSTFATSDPITTWSWSMPGGAPATGTSASTSTLYNTAGTHSVTLIVTTQSGCKDTIVKQLTVYAPPVANFSGGGAGCGPLCNQYNDLSSSSDGNVSNWAWSFPGGTPSSSTLQNPPKICYNIAGSYGASLIISTTYGCKDTIVISPLVTVYSWPNADFCIDHTQAPATDPVFSFCPLWSPNPGVTNWVWNFGDGTALDSTNTNPVHSYSLAAMSNDFSSYTITLLVKNQYGCWDTISKVVELIPEFEFYIPNSFTPNGDNANDLFFGKGRGIKDYSIWIFDRWGNMVWDCHWSEKNTVWDGNGKEGMPSACKWDGKVVKGGVDMSGNSGQLVQEDVYVWKVKLTDVFDKKHSYVGHVSAIK